MTLSFDWTTHIRGDFARAILLACALLCIAIASDRPFATEPIKVAVFPFELKDFSGAAADMPDARDAGYLEESTEEAKKWLSRSGRYTIVDTAGAQEEPAKTHALKDCNGCAGPIAKTLGADQAMTGLVTRISRTEYTMLIQVYDAGSTDPAAQYFTGLRMGADYSWSRAAKWLMKNKILKERG